MNNNEYHDYVIKDGKLIGDFEKMYNDCIDPWNQSKQPNKYARLSGIQHIKNFEVKSILECGCGLGYYANWIKRETGITPQSIDLSETAIQKAKQLFPELNFQVADVAEDLSKFQENEMVLFSEILWYILPSLDTILYDLSTHFKGRFLMINQVFYKGTQKYGNDYFTSLREMIRYIPFEAIGYTEASLKEDSTVETSTLFKIT